MSGPLYDCYVLATERSAEVAVRFLDRFMPERRPAFDVDDPAEALGLPRGATVIEVFRFLEAHPTRAYAMYWSNERAGPPHNAVLCFTADGCLILGLATAHDDEENLARQTLSELKGFTGSRWGYAGLEEPPAGSREEFVNRAEPGAD